MLVQPQDMFDEQENEIQDQLPPLASLEVEDDNNVANQGGNLSFDSRGGSDQQEEANDSRSAINLPPI